MPLGDTALPVRGFATVSNRKNRFNAVCVSKIRLCCTKPSPPLRVVFPSRPSLIFRNVAKGKPFHTDFLFETNDRVFASSLRIVSLWEL
eukprot:9479004-Pyramimonas_sp.AAC.1